MIDPGLPATLGGWIGHWARERPEAAALLTDAAPIGFAALHRRAGALAGCLQNLGIGPQDIVAAQLPNGVAFVVTYLATSLLGATLQTIHMPYRAAEIAPLLGHSRAKAMICPAHAKDISPAALAVSLRGKIPSLQHVIAVGGDVPGALPWPPATDLPDPPVRAKPAPEARFLLLYTSGTTAAPKGVPIASANFLPSAAEAARELGIGGDSIVLSAAPLTHLYGLFSLHLAFTAGAATALLPAFTPPGLAAALERHRPTALFTAPAHMAACLEAGLLTPERLASLRFAMISGSVCARELAAAVQDRLGDGKVLQLWGMSELQAGAFTRPGDDLERRLTTAGRASPGTRLRIADAEAALEPGHDGELQVKGPSVFAGYLGNADDTARAFTRDGWFRTGDLARMDAAGFVTITGRLKELINRGGVKFNPADVENLLSRHSGVESCAIVPMPDPVLGERACCFIVPRAGQVPTLHELCRWLAAHDVAKLIWPERLELIDAMPMTPTRKTMKGELARRAALLRPIAGATPAR